VTTNDRQKLDEALDTFKKFSDFIKFSYDNDIVFYHEEWEEYRDKVKNIVGEYDDEVSDVAVDVGGLILPQCSIYIK